jgi:ATP-dependent helicase/nuclease subunit A
MSVGNEILAKNLMILASAGSGKTFQLGNRVIGLIAVHEVEPERIVALTFTRKAAGEFADSVVTKLAEAALDSEKAEDLCSHLGKQFEIFPVLEKIVRSLPRLQLGTMDGFFTRVVRGFQYELGLAGGTFDLIEGPRLQSAMAEIHTSLLGGLLEEGQEDSAEEFLHAFRRATLGKEGQGVLKLVEEFMKHWHGLWKTGIPLEGWGGAAVWGALPEVEAWEQGKSSLITALRDCSDHKAVQTLLDVFDQHTVGSGLLAKKGRVLFERLLEQVPEAGAMKVTVSRKEISFDAMESQNWRALFALVAGCELAAAVARTQAVGELVRRLDTECHRRLRSRGLLGFDDVKNLMGAWTRSEDDRLRREAVDFRLDARYDHWLLDEFQDTSVAEWEGIEPLLDEAAGQGDGTLFVVGDRKQAIYGWRGGDVSLFDRIEERYGEDLSVCTMPESYRSCPAVLELVNRVCGDTTMIAQLFGSGMVERWPWEEHVSAKPSVTGCARVEEVPKEDMGSRLIETLREVGAGERDLSCGVLVRTNKEVRDTAACLREEGFDVIEEGRRLPVEDNPVGVALLHLVRWLADPADAFAHEVVTMSPLAAQLEARYGEHVQGRWEGSLTEAQNSGFAVMVEMLVEPLWGDLSAFARRRAGDVIGALSEFDAGPGSTAREARDWISKLEISQAPGAAAVQVMTVHKSKGLGFDVVILPALEDKQVPDRGKYGVARGGAGEGAWLLQPPAKWARDLLPDLREAENRWADDQCYEALCLLYVALTRAKRGLYVLLPEVPKSRLKKNESFSSLANWVRLSVGDEGSFEDGDPHWFSSVKERERSVAASPAVLGEAVAKRQRATPSSAKTKSAGARKGGAGRQVGSEVHALFEQVAWLAPGEVPKLLRSQAGAIVEDFLREESCHQHFEKPKGGIVLHREQSFEVLLDGKWMSGAIDRMHVHRDDEGKVIKVDIYDFKTDRVESMEALKTLYEGQMEAYRRAVVEVLGCEDVHAWLMSTGLQETAEVK